MPLRDACGKYAMSLADPAPAIERGGYLVMNTDSVRFALIGTGFIGKTHAIAMQAVSAVFPEIAPVTRRLIVDADPLRAAEAAAQYGFRGHGTDWKAAIDDPDIDALSICTPNHLHKEIVLAAAAARKHVYCEKPVGLNAEESGLMTKAAEAAGITHIVGFNYLVNPAIRLAKDMVAGGELGEITSFIGRYDEDYMADPAVPFSWRSSRELAGAGALADLGAHLINMAQHLVGPIAEASASLQTVIAHRNDPDEPSRRRPVENEDQAQMLVRFAGGAHGSLSVSRIAVGRKNGLVFELTGSRGCLSFDQERFNELKHYEMAGRPATRGFRTILIGPQHPDYGHFCVAPGHGLGYNDLKTIEMRNFLRAIASGRQAWPDLRAGLEVDRVIEAAEASHRERRWITIGSES